MGSASVAAEVTASRTYVDATQAANSYDTRIDPVPACGSGTAATCETITGCAWGASRSLPACLPACLLACLPLPARSCCRCSARSCCRCRMHLLLVAAATAAAAALAAGCWLVLPSLRFFQRCVFSLSLPLRLSACPCTLACRWDVGMRGTGRRVPSRDHHWPCVWFRISLYCCRVWLLHVRRHGWRGCRSQLRVRWRLRGRRRGSLRCGCGAGGNRTPPPAACVFI